MCGVTLTRHGGPEALVWREDLPVPRPGAGEVLLRVRAAGVNNTDINTREGWYAAEVTGAAGETGDGVEAGGWSGALRFPLIQGGDLCGEVVAQGPGVTAPALGARVTCPINIPRPTPDNPVGFVALGSEIDGAFADYCLMKADDLHDVTDAPLSDIEIAAIPCGFGTAMGLLDRAGVAAGQEVLITGASGNVMGARVTGIAAPSKAATVMEEGAAEVIARDTPLPPDRYHAVIDLVGGPGVAALIDALRPGGQYAVAGAIAGPMIEADLRRIYLRDITLHGCTFQPPHVFARLMEMVRAGEVRPRISATYPLRDIARAQAEFQAKTHTGKLVLLPPETDT
jgi:alcohol dehydrogenase